MEDIKLTMDIVLTNVEVKIFMVRIDKTQIAEILREIIRADAAEMNEIINGLLLVETADKMLKAVQDRSNQADFIQDEHLIAIQEIVKTAKSLEKLLAKKTGRIGAA